MKTTKLEQLSAYLPYNLICLVNGKYKAEMNAVYSNGTCTFHSLIESDKGFKSVKPILKPLELFININSKEFEELNCDINHQIEINEVACRYRHYTSMSVGAFQICLKNHIDIFGLIDSGEAVLDK